MDPLLHLFEVRQRIEASHHWVAQEELRMLDQLGWQILGGQRVGMGDHLPLAGVRRRAALMLAGRDAMLRGTVLSSMLAVRLRDLAPCRARSRRCARVDGGSV